MLKSILCLFICCLFISIESAAQGDLNTHKLFNESSLLNNIKSLSSDTFEGRRTGTNGNLRAKKYIINQFHVLNVLPLVKNYNQTFTFTNKRSLYRATNILGLIKGSELSNKYIVLSAHYDHEGVKYGEIYNGADDNASGISALFSFAEYFIKNPPKHSIILAAFDAEELGLQGSKYFVNNSIVSKKDIVLNINMDMISRSERDELFVVGATNNKQLKYIVSNIEESKNIKLLTGHDGYDGLENWTYASDHANFYKKDIPFLYFGVEDHKDYHEPTDDYENIKPEFYINAVKTIITVFEKIDNSKF